jgi:hypothetical protein
MRFKNLKAAVMIALIVFILVVGNILAFGLMNKNVSAASANAQQGAIIAQVGSKKSAVQAIQTVPSVEPSPQQVVQQPTDAQAQAAQPQPQPQPTVIVQRVRTRAS